MSQSDVIKMPILLSKFPRFIYLNGPTNCGKTELSLHLQQLDSGILVYHHQTPLWEIADVLHSHSSVDSDPLNFEDPEIRAALCCDTTNATTWETFFSAQEHLVRQSFGGSFFSSAAMAYATTNSQADTIVFSDVNELSDIDMISTLTSNRNQVLIRIENPDVSWEFQRGSYVFPDIPSVTITHTGDEAAFIDTCIAYLTK